MRERLTQDDVRRSLHPPAPEPLVCDSDRRFRFEEAAIEPHPVPVDPLVHDRYLSIKDKFRLLALWRRTLDLPYDDAEFERAFRLARHFNSKHGWEEGREKLGVDLVIVPYLATTLETFRFLRARLYGAYPTKQEVQPAFRGRDAERGLRLLPEIALPRFGLRVEMIDLHAYFHPDERVLLRRSRGRRSAHAGVLAALAMDLAYGYKMNGTTTPFPFLPGYEVNVSPEFPWDHVQLTSQEPWAHSPIVYSDQRNRRLLLCARSLDESRERVSAPLILEYG